MKKLRFQNLLLLLIIFFSINSSLYAKSLIEDQWQQFIYAESLETIELDDQIKIRFEQTVGYANLGNIEEAMNELEVLKELEGGKFTHKLIKDYIAIVNEDSENLFLLNFLAFAYYANSQYLSSVSYFDKIIKLDSENFWAYLYLAIVKGELKEYDSSLELLLRAKEIEENEYLHLLLSLAYYKKGKYLQAMWHLGKSGNIAVKFLR
ncbi:MAG: hypothetical protein KAX49_05090 [Halanaerobiales bacterium]|nr:hypothetical protein [Halanaerobiales bacterium]